MCSRRRLFHILPVFWLVILTLAGAAPDAICRATGVRPQETQPVAGQGTLAQRSTAKLIASPDPRVKWRITDNRFVERTTDAGVTWDGQELATQADLLAGSAPSATICWVVGRNGVVYVTKGARKGNKVAWNEVTAPVSADLVAVSAKSASSAIVTTADGREFEARDGGKKWEQASGSR